MIKICKAFMTPRSLPVINSSHLRNHKTGLQYLNIRSNCLATSKKVPKDWEKSQKGGGGGGQFHLQRLYICGLVEPCKAMGSKLLFAIKLMGESLPAIFPCCWHRVFVHIQISQTVARVRLRSDTMMMYRRTCLGISFILKTHTRKRAPCKNCVMKPRWWYCGFYFTIFMSALCL